MRGVIRWALVAACLVAVAWLLDLPPFWFGAVVACVAIIWGQATQLAEKERFIAAMPLMAKREGSYRAPVANRSASPAYRIPDATVERMRLAVDGDADVLECIEVLLARDELKHLPDRPGGDR